MDNESPTRMESDLLEKIRASNTTIRTKITTVRLVKVGTTDIEIKPRDIGEDTQGWSVGEAEIPCQTLENAIIVGMEMQARG
jgi:hypothetical protein|tara:strand:+ start:1270 stop:1515 length:246 start_codon:yes stop_codon:yes gene_type:complete